MDLTTWAPKFFSRPLLSGDLIPAWQSLTYWPFTKLWPKLCLSTWDILSIPACPVKPVRCLFNTYWTPTMSHAPCKGPYKQHLQSLQQSCQVSVILQMGETEAQERPRSWDMLKELGLEPRCVLGPGFGLFSDHSTSQTALHSSVIGWKAPVI